MEIQSSSAGRAESFAKKRKKTGGRRKGTPNKVNQALRVQRETCQEIFKNMLGLEMPDTQTIDGEAVKVREILGKMFNGTRRVNRNYLDLLKFGMAYAYGTPLKMDPQTATQAHRMAYVGRRGLPWEHDVMAQQEREALEAQETQRKLEAQVRQQQLQGAAPDLKDDEDDGEAPEIV